MKYIITESQHKMLSENNDVVKKALFRYWDKKGPDISYNTLNMFGIKTLKGDVIPWLWDWYKGEENSWNKAYDFLTGGVHIIDDCGSCNFKFMVTDVTIIDTYENSYTYQVDVVIDGGGTMSPINDPTTTYTLTQLSQVLDDKDENELSDCIYEYLEKSVYNKFGYLCEYINTPQILDSSEFNQNYSHL